MPNLFRGGIREFLKKFDDEDACKKFYAQLRWKGKPVCPYCKSTDVWEYKSRPIYCCKPCNRQFRCTTGTIFESSKISIKEWFFAIYLMTTLPKGISALRLSKELKCTPRRAWAICNKIREALGNVKYRYLKDEVEIDEVYLGGRRKGTKRGRYVGHKAPVVALVQRKKGAQKSRVILVPTPDTKRDTLFPIIYAHVRRGSTIYTDEYLPYRGLSQHYNHETVNHGEKEYARGNVHVNNAENIFMHTRAMMRTYHRASKKYTYHYAKEMEFRFNNRGKSHAAIFMQALRQADIRVKG